MVRASVNHGRFSHAGRGARYDVRRSVTVHDRVEETVWDPMQTLVTGDLFATLRQVTQQQIDAYALASGDHNPLHTDPAFAATTPLGGTVAHGMLVLAWLSALLTDRFGEDWVAKGSFRVRFRAPARPGDELELSVTVRTLQEAPAGRRATLDLLVANQRQETVIDGQATLPFTAAV